VRFDELAKDFLTDYRINGKDVVRAELSVRHLKPIFGSIRVTEITTPRIKGYIEQRLRWACSRCKEAFLADEVENTEDPVCPYCDSKEIVKGATNATINRELAALKRMLNLGAQQTPPKVDRIPHIPMLKENNVRKGFFEHEEFLSLRSALPSHLYGFVTFGYKTGWRISEIADLTWSQVDLKQGIVTLEVGETKNDEARTVYLDDELKAIFIGQWNQPQTCRKVVALCVLKRARHRQG